ncbi:MAG: L-histidine N(alpha)-methyltransferase [Coleofasciculus chthonoplastes F3-SA18-01]|uniref:L-histidine N(alpha)-methyltransferase n=1 Tax=Coleofasciculus chthonoplastes TaxID=64178 RepID=UPI0032FD0C8C
MSKSQQNPICHTAQPSAEFFSIFSDAEILDIIQTLAARREISLKYSYKGQGANIWDKFYLNYLRPRWYRPVNREIALLNDNFEIITRKIQAVNTVNIIDVGAGNSYPVKQFIHRLNRLGRINRYIALDISDDLLKVSQQNIKKWFPHIEFISDRIDIENNSLSQTLLNHQVNLKAEDTAQIILHLGVTMGNHHNITAVLQNFRDSMGKHDILAFTNEIGSNCQWDGTVRGGLKYHVDNVYTWVKNALGIQAEDCELVRKYDPKTDSIVAKIKFSQNYRINFRLIGEEKCIEIAEEEEIAIWRQHKFEIPELVREIEQAGLQLIHYKTDNYSSNIMVICEIDKLSCI